VRTDAQDERPFIRCTACRKFAKCYRGPLVKVVDDGVGNQWEHWAWYCVTCLAAIVGEALREDETRPKTPD
jgi:hypothetical protein